MYLDVSAFTSSLVFIMMRKLDPIPCDSYILAGMMDFMKRMNVILEGTTACNDSRSEITEKEDHLESVGIRSSMYG
jgi:hypothetical protein